jgi:hypothetical protein
MSYSQVAQYKADYASQTIESSRMPRPFTAAFMAALAVVLAHTLYQMFAPETVRRMTLDQYIADRMEDYSKHPTPDSIQEASEIIGVARDSNMILPSQELSHNETLGIIAKAARFSYLRMASTSWAAIILTALIYSFAIYMISSIIVTQAISVMNATEIDSIGGAVDGPFKALSLSHI